MKKEQRVVNNTQGSTVCETNNTKSLNQQKYQNSIEFTSNETITSRVGQSRLLEEKNERLPKFKNIIKINRTSGIGYKLLKKSREQI